MTILFMRLMTTCDTVSGGVAVVTGTILRSRSELRLLGRIVQWGYWFGWSPAMAINAALAGYYLDQVAFEGKAPFAAYIIAVVTLTVSVCLNDFGLSVSARLQLVLVALWLLPLTVAFVVALVRTGVPLHDLTPFAPTGGWIFPRAALLVIGGLFLAGWSAYGCEIALSYAPEYVNGLAGAFRAAKVVGVVTIAASVLLPAGAMAVTASVGPSEDIVLTLIRHSFGSTAAASSVMIVVLVAFLLCAVNMIGVSSSRVLRQMAFHGDAWGWLGALNRWGAPRNALLVDYAFNLALLTVAAVLNLSSISAVPLFLLAAANIGYVLSLTICLATCWLKDGSDCFLKGGPTSLTRGRVPALVLCGFNAILLMGAGASWGWSEVAMGVLFLTAAVVLLSPWRTAGRKARVPSA